MNAILIDNPTYSHHIRIINKLPKKQENNLCWELKFDNDICLLDYSLRKVCIFRVFFADETTAVTAVYRPCSVCMQEIYKS